MTTLPPKQELFCQEYLLDHNATQAAVRAGYISKNPRKTAYELKNTPAIRDRIAALTQERNSELLITYDYVLDNLVEIVNRCLQGEPVRSWNAQQQCWIPTGEWKFDADSARRALDSIAKHIGMDEQIKKTEEVKTSAEQGMNREQFDKLIGQLRANAAMRSAQQGAEVDAK